MISTATTSTVYRILKFTVSGLLQLSAVIYYALSSRGILSRRNGKHDRQP